MKKTHKGEKITSLARGGIMKKTWEARLVSACREVYNKRRLDFAEALDAAFGGTLPVDIGYLKGLQVEDFKWLIVKERIESADFDKDGLVPFDIVRDYGETLPSGEYRYPINEKYSWIVGQNDLDFFERNRKYFDKYAQKIEHRINY